MKNTTKSKTNCKTMLEYNGRKTWNIMQTECNTNLKQNAKQIWKKIKKMQDRNETKCKQNGR